MQTALSPSAVEGSQDRVSSELIRHLSHELSDSLGAVESLVYLAQRRSSLQDQVLLYLGQIPKLVDQANRVIRGAAHYLGAVPMHPEPADLNVLLAEAIAANFSESGPDLRIDLAPIALPVMLDPTHGEFLCSNLIATFLRLAHNAPEMLVRTISNGAEVELILECAERHRERDLARLSEPFRPLAAARSVVAAHGGRLTAGCTSGARTWLRVVLPRQAVARVQVPLQ
jgi:signal transduction histidine kinase